MLNVHFLHPPENPEFLRERLDPNIRLTDGPEIPLDTQILVAGRPTREQLETSPHLHTILIPFAGMPQTTAALMVEYPHIAVHNLHHNAPIVAEMVMALLLTAAKFIVPADQRLRQHNWTVRYGPPPAMMLAGKTALILGYGAIGQHVGVLCEAFGMKILATRRNGGQGIYPPAALHELLPQADALLITLPQTPETVGLIGEQELALLPDQALLVNVGRGPIVDQKALYEALRDKRLRGAALDVWYNYPTDEASRTCTPPADYPFHELDNVVLSPHRGGATDETEHYRMTHLAQSLNALARGEPMPNRIDLSKGY